MADGMGIPPESGDETPEVSFVMPCLNEARTVAACVEAARRCIEENGLRAEIVVGDNGSTDGSQELARAAGARVVAVPQRGYGAALLGAIAAARGGSIVMADADLSYDFGASMPFVAKMREGYELVMGTRFGPGARIEPGAMPWKHRWLGNPVLSFIGRWLYRVPVRDFHCGMRGFSKAAIERLNLRTTGMEFASEMVMKAALRKLRMTEVPITLRPDARGRPPHLRSWRDGWRHLRFMLCLSPRWTLLVPGLAIFVIGLLLLWIVGIAPLRFAGVTLDVHTMVAGSLLTLVGYQFVTAAIAMRIFALEEELGVPPPNVARLFEIFTLERGVLVGVGLCLIGTAMIGIPVRMWMQADFGPLDVERTLRPMIAGATLVALGVQTVLMSFVYSMMGIKRL